MPCPDYAYAFINFVMRPANMAAINNNTAIDCPVPGQTVVDATMTANRISTWTRPATSGSFGSGI